MSSYLYVPPPVEPVIRTRTAINNAEIYLRELLGPPGDVRLRLMRYEPLFREAVQKRLLKPKISLA